MVQSFVRDIGPPSSDEAHLHTADDTAARGIGVHVQSLSDRRPEQSKRREIYGDGEVDPLDGFQGSDAVRCVWKQDVGTEDGGDDGPNGLNSLCDADRELCIPRGADDCKVTMS